MKSIYLKNFFNYLGYHGCHALIDERNVSLHQFYLYIGFIDIPTIDQNDHLTLLGKKF